MRLANRLFLLVVLLALPAATARATGNANNIAPCRTFTNVADCQRFCISGELYDTCACFWDDPADPNGFPLDHSSGSVSPICSETSPCC